MKLGIGRENRGIQEVKELTETNARECAQWAYNSDLTWGIEGNGEGEAVGFEAETQAAALDHIAGS